MKPRILRNLILISAASLGLAACNEGYGYGGLNYGYGGGYYDGYYGSPYYGWYDGWYYPGTGYYVYDRRGTRRNWDDGQRRYWESRRGNWNGNSQWRGREGNWNGRRDGTWNGRRDGNWNGNRTGNWSGQRSGTPNSGTGRPMWRGGGGTATPAP